MDRGFCCLRVVSSTLPPFSDLPGAIHTRSSWAALLLRELEQVGKISEPVAFVAVLPVIELRFLGNIQWELTECPAILTMVAFSVIGHWFDKKRGIAMGFCTMGTGLGGIFFALILRLVLESRGWRDSALILAAIVFVFLAVGLALVESRLPASHHGIWDFNSFKSLRFLLFSASVFGE